jgi:hypothetical protein
MMAKLPVYIYRLVAKHGLFFIIFNALIQDFGRIHTLFKENFLGRSLIHHPHRNWVLKCSCTHRIIAKPSLN